MGCDTGCHPGRSTAPSTSGARLLGSFLANFSRPRCSSRHGRKKRPHCTPLQVEGQMACARHERSRTGRRRSHE